MMILNITKNQFPMDLHIKAHHLNHWLFSLYAFKYLHFSVTILSRGGTNILVFSQTLIKAVWEFCADSSFDQSSVAPPASLTRLLDYSSEVWI